MTGTWPIPADPFHPVHGVNTTNERDRLDRRGLPPVGLTNACRVTDARTSTVFRLAHLADTMVLVNPDTFAARLKAASFVDADVETSRSAFRFRAVAPAADRAARPG